MSWTDDLELNRLERQTLIAFITEELRKDSLKRGSVMSPSSRYQLESALAKLERVR